MEIEKIFFLFCENAILDDKKRLTLVNLFEVLNTNSVPVMLPQFYLVTNLFIKESFENKTLKVSFSITSPSGKEVLTNPPAITKPVSKGKNEGFIVKLNRLLFPEFGKYSVKLLINKSEFASMPLTIRKVSKKDAN